MRIHRLTRLALFAIAAASLGGLIQPAPVSAHPLGNFTINRYNGLTIGTERVIIDRVVDMAEIPALQAHQDMDVDRDTAVSSAEGARWATDVCRAGASDLRLAVSGMNVALTPTALGLSFPPGQAGLSTVRLVCTYQGHYPSLAQAGPVAFSDESYAGRIGWREIVVRGDGVTVVGGEHLSSGLSNRLRSYPAELLAAPRADVAARLTAVPGGAPASSEPITDAVAWGSPPELVLAASRDPAPDRGPVDDPMARLNEIIQVPDLTPPAIVLALAVSVLVGALHAASPGHGKTLMAAYLVGTRGTVRHALALGLTVTVSHTIGVLALGAVVVFAGAVVPSERLFPILGLVSGLIVTAIGALLLAQRIGDARRRRRHERDHEHGHTHEHAHAHDAVAGWHSHGLVGHTHLPAAADGDNPLRWRNLAALGLVGGLVPSASAILILVGSIAAARPAFGMLLTVAFGIGMAVVLVGVGVVLVHARDLVERWPMASRLEPLFARLPLVTAVVFVAVGGAIALSAGGQLT